MVAALLLLASMGHMVHVLAASGSVCTVVDGELRSCELPAANTSLSLRDAGIATIAPGAFDSVPHIVDLYVLWCMRCHCGPDAVDFTET